MPAKVIKPLLVHYIFPGTHFAMMTETDSHGENSSCDRFGEVKLIFVRLNLVIC